MPGGRPPKPLQLIQGHRTKAEKEIRAKAESELLTGVTMKEAPEVRANPIAHKEFVRIRKLLKAIKKDDDLYGNLINTHCLLVAEIKGLEEMRGGLADDLEKFDERTANEDLSFAEKTQIKLSLRSQLISLDKQIQAKRKMVLDISKENIMTIQSALRSIPKEPPKKEESKMATFLNKRGGGNVI